MKKLLSYEPKGIPNVIDVTPTDEKVDTVYTFSDLNEQAVTGAMRLLGELTAMQYQGEIGKLKIIIDVTEV